MLHSNVQCYIHILTYKHIYMLHTYTYPKRRLAPPHRKQPATHMNFGPSRTIYINTVKSETNCIFRNKCYNINTAVGLLEMYFICMHSWACV